MMRHSRTALSILIYHRVLARPDPLFPAQVDARIFERQLGLLKRFFSILPLHDAVRRLRDGRLPPRAACITFDDGYADNAEVALPLLQKHGLRACFFIATGYLDGGQMWNDSVIECVREAPGKELDLSGFGLGRFSIATLELRRAAIAAILASLKYLPFDQREVMAAHIWSGRRAGPAQLMMTSGQVLALHRAGMEIGAHTVTHPILATQSEPDARADIAASKRRLECLTGAPVRLFAYPNGVPGRDYDARHVEMVKTLGFDAAVASKWGVARQGGDPYQLPRFTPWDHGRLRFVLRMCQNLLRREP